MGAGFDELGGPVTVLTGLICAYGLARLALALPAMPVGGHDLPGSLREAASVTRGRTLLNGTALIAVVVVPALAVAVATRLAVPGGDSWVGSWIGDAVGSWVGDAVWAGVAPLLGQLALLAAFPLQAAVLAGAYQVATATAADAATAAPPVDTSTEPLSEGQPELAPTLRPVRWVRAAGVALLMVVPAVVHPAAVLANPRGLPVATMARPEVGFSSRPPALTVLSDGTVATVDNMQVGLCLEAHCSNVDLMSMPCLAGAEPQPAGAGARSCPIEAPLDAADITADGRLLALTRGEATRPGSSGAGSTATPPMDSAGGAARSCTAAA